jgi:hypothetical protein
VTPAHAALYVAVASTAIAAIRGGRRVKHVRTTPTRPRTTSGRSSRFAAHRSVCRTPLD